ncbi:MAG: ComEC/Rec2 family competence protein, partial [Gemmatimonadota bacterium]
LAVLLPLALIPTSSRPLVRGAFCLTLVAGFLAAGSTQRADGRDCRLLIPDEWEGVVVGRTVSRVEVGRTVPFRPEQGLPDGCARTVRILLTGEAATAEAGERIRVRVRWEARGHVAPGRAEWAGMLRVVGGLEPSGGGDRRGQLLRLRGGIQEEIHRLWRDRAPMVEALVLARREHLDPDLREAFAHSGTAHLLAISGFHVGVVAGLLMGLLRLLGLRPRRAAIGAAVGCWIYVLGIGAPHAAVRAALLLTLLAVARVRGRPIVPVGALATALLTLLVLDPRNLASIGFQLSFAGTGGLVLLRRPLTNLADGLSRRVRGRPISRGRSARGPAEGLLKGGSDGLVTGIAATLPTLPLLAWHFDRISLVGI